MKPYAYHPATPIIVDTDSSVDDLLGLALLKQANAPVKAIIVSYGAFALADASERVLRLTRFLDWNIPVILGSSKPLNRSYTPKDVGHGKHQPSLPESVARLAHQLITQRYNTQSWIGELSTLDIASDVIYICMGPHTNLSQLLEKHKWRQAIKYCVMNGGTFEYPGDYNTYSEYNFSWDPCATTSVLQAAIAGTILPLNCTDKILMTPKHITQLKPTIFDIKLIQPYLYHYMNVRKQFTSVQKNHQYRYLGAAMHGLASAVYTLKPNYFSEYPVAVQTDLIQTYRGMVYAKPSKRSNIKLANKTNHYLFWNYISKLLFTGSTH